MEASNTFYHAITIDRERCQGCSRCMKICPTEAIRMRNGKATILAGRCVDCGKCYTRCASRAVVIKQDDFDAIRRYKHSVALVPTVFLGQFPNEIRVSRIYAAMKELGFRHVFEVESATDVYVEAKRRYADEHHDTRPLISSYCPAVVRLIQVKYPALVDNLMPLKAPLDLSALYALHKLEEEGIRREEVGLFYITPCAAKISAVKSPVGETRSEIDGVINMDALYNRVYKIIKEQGAANNFVPLAGPRLSSDAILLPLTNGERRLCSAKRAYAVDGMENVMEFLEKLENGEIEGVEFLELRACDQSCAGATLSCQNRFLCGERMYARARKVAEREKNGERAHDRELRPQREWLIRQSRVDAIKPRSMMALDSNVGRALEKMEQLRRLSSALPQIDCGLCGAPTCNTLATDCVCGQASPNDCLFFRRHTAAASLQPTGTTAERQEGLRTTGDSPLASVQRLHNETNPNR